MFTHLDGIHKLLEVVAISMQRVAGGEEGDGLATLVQQHWAGGRSQTSTGKEIKDETAWEEIRHGDNKEHSLQVPHLVFVEVGTFILNYGCHQTILWNPRIILKQKNCLFP